MKKNIFAGLGLGVLIGVIIGLSIAEVTGIILGALTSLLTAFFGLRSNKDGETGNQIIIGTFGFTCLISIFIGMYIRTHNLLSPSLNMEVQEYREASFDTSDIKRIVLFKRFGLVPEGYSFSKEAKQLNGSNQSVLMSGNVNSEHLCVVINENSTLEEIKEAFTESGLKYQEIQKGLSSIISDPDELRKTLLHLKNVICEK